MTDAQRDERERPLNAGHDAPSTEWTTAPEMRPDLAGESSDETTPAEEGATGRNQDPENPVAVQPHAPSERDEDEPERSYGQEAGSVSEPG